jgi:hypothetical protein
VTGQVGGGGEASGLGKSACDGRWNGTGATGNVPGLSILSVPSWAFLFLALLGGDARVAAYNGAEIYWGRLG